jgi:hypothetical protein
MIPLYTKEEFNKAKSNDFLKLKCENCGNTFSKQKKGITRIFKPSKGFTGDCCSFSCVIQLRNEKLGRTPITVVCAYCDKVFLKQPNNVKRSRNHFCSRSCSGTYNNTHKTQGTRVSKLEKWLQAKLIELYPNLEVIFNGKEAINSELDIYIPSLKLAFELNGIFHYEPIYGPDKLLQIQNNDGRKFQACIENGISLCIIDTSTQKYFKESTSQKYLDIITKLIDSEL